MKNSFIKTKDGEVITRGILRGELKQELKDVVTKDILKQELKDVVTKGFLKQELKEAFKEFKVELTEVFVTKKEFKEQNKSVEKCFDVVTEELKNLRHSITHLDSTVSSYRHGAVLVERDVKKLDDRVLKLELKGRGAVA